MNFIDREGTIQINDEIVNVCGQSVRGLSILQLRELLVDAYNDRKRTDMDLVICRYGGNVYHCDTVTKSRIKLSKAHIANLDDSFADDYGDGAAGGAIPASFCDMNDYACSSMK